MISHYAALAKRENIPFQANAALPAHISIDQIDMCLVLSNLLENALEASLKAKPFNRRIHAEVYLHHKHLLLIQVENTFEGKYRRKIIFSSRPSVPETEWESSLSATLQKKTEETAASLMKMVFLLQKLCCAYRKQPFLIYKQSREVSCRHTLERI